MSEPIVKEPSKCSPAELERFLESAQDSGEVSALGLLERIQSAARLIFCESDGILTRIAAIKRPLDSYRFNVSRKAGVKLPQDQFPYELGWVFVAPAARKNGLSVKLVACAVNGLDEQIFATSRADNEAMHRTLRHFGFVAVGNDYASAQGHHRIQLFTRSGNADVRKSGSPTTQQTST
jgi:predicted GNAT family N-acyltransferase